LAVDLSDLPAPTSVSLPARDGYRTIELPLNDDYPSDDFRTLESLAVEESASLLIDDEDDDFGSELSVVFRGAHQSERPVHPESSQGVRWSGGRNRGAVPPPSSPPLASDDEIDIEIPEPPRLPGEVITPPPPAPAAANFDDADDDDFDDDVVTMVKVPDLPPAAPPPISVPAPPPVSVPPPQPARVPTATHNAPTLPPRRSGVPPVDSLRPVEVRSAPQPVPQRSRSAVDGIRRSGWLALAAGCIFGGAAIAAAGVWLEGERGELVIDVADQQCGAVDGVQIYVDDKLVCTSSPCTLQVSTGSHVVSAQADGYELTAPRAVLVDPEMPTLHRVQFGASNATGIEVKSQHDGYSLYLDGKLVGELPQRVTGLSVGEHTLLVSGGEGFYAEEKKIDLEADEMLVLENIELKPRMGTLRIAESAQLEGAKVTLDGASIDLPYEAQIDASKSHRLVARRAGFEDFETTVEFTANKLNRSVDIELTPKAARSEDREAADSSSTRASRSRPSHARASSASGARKATGKATLSLTSDPPSNVLLDGKPIGSTPKVGLSVSPGTHTVLFVHPTLGRARAAAKLAPGQKKTLRAKF
jgi:serine/threonine-protein kinase